MVDQVKILMVEDEADDYVLVRDLLTEISPRYALQWVTSYEAARSILTTGDYDVCLMDYALGAHTGLDLLREAAQEGCRVPIILLTAQNAYEIDLEAMRAGASDFLIKDQVNGPLLDRSIRYAMERTRHADELRKSHYQLRQLSAQLLNAQEDERKRIAKELHDGVGQILTAVKFGVENSLQMGGCQHVECRQSLKSVITIIQSGIDEIRRISRDLWPAMMNEFGLLSTINCYCREFQNIFSGIRVEKSLDLCETDIPDPLKITIYRIVQEATNNAAKHSKGDLVVIALKKSGGFLELSIRDNGQGFNLNPALPSRKSRQTLGLSSMRERAELSGGLFSINTAPGKGTVVAVSWGVLARQDGEA